ncbi:MAG: VWA domain-containing protein [Chloroflexi bacterium]|nr:VWA domain-containing protein [Chloroflexota bacterium]
MNHSFRKLWIYGLLLTLFVCTTGFSAHPQAGSTDEEPIVRITQVDTSGFPKVTVYVSVTDANGEPLGVDASQLVLQENGVTLAPDQVQGTGEIGPLTTMLVIDVSGSMLSADKLKAAKAVAKDYVDQMRSGDRAGLIQFNTEVGLVQDITSDKEALKAAIDGLSAQGDTAMYDAVQQAIETLNLISGRKAIIALTDGLDNRSVSTPDDVINSIGSGGVSISTVGLGEPGQGRGALTALDEEALKSLAERAGGLYGYANDQDSLKKLYDQYARALQSEYVMVYTSPSKLRDGVNRALSVSFIPLGASSGVQTNQSVYNPGGLVPEVAQPAPWPTFFMLLGGLVLLLFIPSLIGMVSRPSKAKAAPKKRAMPTHRKATIKLKD